MLPKLREIDKPRSEEQWNKLLAETTQALLNAMPKKDQNTDFWTKGAAAAAMAYPKAIQQLQQFGYSKSAIDAMPIAQAILTATVETYKRQRDSLHRWFYLPYPEASMAMDEEERRVNNTDEIIPFGKILMPSMRWLDRRKCGLIGKWRPCELSRHCGCTPRAIMASCLNN